MSWNNNNFDSGGYGDSGGGGGFQASSQPSGDSGTGGSFRGKGRDGEARAPSTLIALTCRQCLLADLSDGKCRVDNADVSLVSLVGQIHSIVSTSITISFTLDDGTCEIQARMFSRDTELSKGDGLDLVTEFNYVRLTGRIQEMNGARSFLGTNLKKITDFNEVTFHGIEALHNHIRNTVGLPSANAPNQQNQQQMQFNKAMPGAFSAAAPGGATDDRKILYAFFLNSSVSSSIGTSIHEASEATRIPYEKCAVMIRELADDGMLYSTSDENHFKAIDS